jgi:hypothetical protein
LAVDVYVDNLTGSKANCLQSVAWGLASIDEELRCEARQRVGSGIRHKRELFVLRDPRGSDMAAIVAEVDRAALRIWRRTGRSSHSKKSANETTLVWGSERRSWMAAGRARTVVSRRCHDAERASQYEDGGDHDGRVTPTFSLVSLGNQQVASVPLIRRTDRHRTIIGSTISEVNLARSPRGNGTQSRWIRHI